MHAETLGSMNVDRAHHNKHVTSLQSAYIASASTHRDISEPLKWISKVAPGFRRVSHQTWSQRRWITRSTVWDQGLGLRIKRNVT
jgi:hypothetical protein